MRSKLEQLRKFTTVVADTGDITAIAKYFPQDATTNPSLILKAAHIPQYSFLIDDAIAYAKKRSLDIDLQVLLATDHLAINIGKDILTLIPGRISTEVDARLSYDVKASVEKARNLIRMYHEKGIAKDRVLIKLAATWQGIRAAQQLEMEGINCNLTLLFSFAQARACAEAGVYLISPFVGRIMDWYKVKENRDFPVVEDPGVRFVAGIYNYYKSHGYNTIVMGASFRNTEQILELAGCDRLTINPELLKELIETEGAVIQKLFDDIPALARPELMSQEEFLWDHHMDAMAVEKLADGIRQFSLDQEKLEIMILERL